LATRFGEQIGLTSKTVARLHTAASTAALMIVEPSPRPWAEITLACGYTDQARLNRDFRALTGSTPTEYRPVDAPRFTRARDSE
jgi:AraC-like DNA-binding protein